MGIPLKTEITNFSGDLTSDKRAIPLNVARVIKHFDTYSVPSKLTPFRSMKADAVTESTLDAYRIQKMAIVNSVLYGVGVVSAVDGHTQVYSKVTPSDPTAAWTTSPGTSTSASSVESNIDAIGYHNYLYGVNTGGVWKYGDVTGAPTFTYNEYTTHIPTARGLVHSKDDNLYWPSNNLILVNNAGSWSVGLTLPTNATINSICEDGNYLDIAADLPDGTSVVYQWDRDSSLSTVSEKIDWGVGSLKLIEKVGGLLVGISTTGGSSNSLTPKIMFKYWSGSRIVTFASFFCANSIVIKDKQKFNDLFYFLAELTIDNVILNGLWRLHKTEAGDMTIAFDRLPRNDTLVNGGSLKGFYRWGDYVFISYINPSGSTYTVWRTDDQANYTATSMWQTRVFNDVPGLRNKRIPDSATTKKLLYVTLMTEALTSGQSATLKYRTDGATSWTTIFTMSTVGQIRHSARSQESGDVTFPNHKEVEFSLESTGGAEITGLKFQTEVIDDDIYS